MTIVTGNLVPGSVAALLVGSSNVTSPPRQWKTRYASEVAERRDLVLAEIFGALPR